MVKEFLEELGYGLDETLISGMFDELSEEEKVEVKKALLEYLDKYLPIKNEE